MIDTSQKKKENNSLQGTMFCAISGKPPIHPVLSPSSRCLFEKELLLQHIEKTGTDPITNSPLKPTDIIEINTNVANSLPNFLNSSTLGSNYSIPTLLSTLQHEYDAIMLENFQLRKEVNKAVQELSKSLYERDAAKLVAAGLLRDRMNVKADLDAIVRYHLEEGGAGVGKSNSSFLHDETQDLLERSQEYVRKIKELRGTLTASAGAKSKNFKTCINVPSKPVSIANCSIESEFITRWPPLCGSAVTTLLTGGQVKKSVVVLSLSTEQDEALVFNFSDNNTNPLSYGLPFDIKDIDLLSVSPDAQRIFLLRDNTNTLNVYNVNSGAHTVLPLDKSDDLESHTILLTQHEYVMRDYILRVTSDGHVFYLSLDKPRLDIDVVLPKETDLEIGKDQVEPLRYHSATLHKDGILLALTSSKSVTIVNLARPQDEPTVFRLGQEIPNLSTTEEHRTLNERVSEVRFSSNGYWMFVCVGYRVVVFDLRKDEATVVSTCIVEELARSDPGESIDMVWDMDPEGILLVAYNRGYGSMESPLVFYKHDKKAKEWSHWTAEYTPNGNSDSPDPVPKLGEDIVGIQLLETTTDDDETLSVLVQCPTKSYVLDYSDN